MVFDICQEEFQKHEKASFANAVYFASLLSI